MVDDFVPCDAETGHVLYARPTRSELWPSILEKAMAKLLEGGYAKLVARSVAEALADLTGCPICVYNHASPRTQENLSSLWGEIHDILAPCRLLAAATWAGGGF